MPDDVELAWRFARATLAHDPAADGFRREIVTRWGPRAVGHVGCAVGAVASTVDGAGLMLRSATSRTGAR